MPIGDSVMLRCHRRATHLPFRATMTRGGCLSPGVGSATSPQTSDLAQNARILLGPTDACTPMGVQTRVGLSGMTTVHGWSSPRTYRPQSAPLSTPASLGTQSAKADWVPSGGSLVGGPIPGGRRNRPPGKSPMFILHPSTRAPGSAQKS